MLGGSLVSVTYRTKTATDLPEFIRDNEIFVELVETLDNLSGLPYDSVVIETIKERHRHRSTSNRLHGH